MNTRPTLLCTVRDCQSELARQPGRVFCPRGHSFDIARSGYINLLQPQDRRSRHPGDSTAALLARRAIHRSGVTRPLLAGIAALLSASPRDTVLDIGSGDGFYLGSLAAEFGFQANGVDISMAAAAAAATEYPTCEWIVANADRFVPFAGHSFSRLLSLTARMHPAEFQRVLQPDGKLLIALPAPDDLIELRASGRDRTRRTIESFAPHFHLVEQRQTTTTAHLEAAAIQNLMLSIYRPRQTSLPPSGRVTLSLDLLLFAPNSPSPPVQFSLS